MAATFVKPGRLRSKAASAQRTAPLSPLPSPRTGAHDEAIAWLAGCLKAEAIMFGDSRKAIAATFTTARAGATA